MQSEQFIRIKSKLFFSCEFVRFFSRLFGECAPPAFHSTERKRKRERDSERLEEIRPNFFLMINMKWLKLPRHAQTQGIHVCYNAFYRRSIDGASAILWMYPSQMYDGQLVIENEDNVRCRQLRHSLLKLLHFTARRLTYDARRRWLLFNAPFWSVCVRIFADLNRYTFFSSYFSVWRKGIIHLFYQESITSLFHGIFNVHVYHTDLAHTWKEREKRITNKNIYAM